MQPAEYAEQDGVGLKGLIDDGQASSEEVRDAALSALEEVDPRLNALVGEPFDDVSYDPAGPLGGVPFAVKDLVCALEGKPIRLTGVSVQLDEVPPQLGLFPAAPPRTAKLNAALEIRGDRLTAIYPEGRVELLAPAVKAPAKAAAQGR